MLYNQVKTAKSNGRTPLLLSFLPKSPAHLARRSGISNLAFGLQRGIKALKHLPVNTLTCVKAMVIAPTKAFRTHPLR